MKVKELTDDMTQWPDLLFRDVYSYLIETKGPYTKGKFLNLLMCLTISFVDTSALGAVLVNPSQKMPLSLDSCA